MAKDNPSDYDRGQNDGASDRNRTSTSEILHDAITPGSPRSTSHESDSYKSGYSDGRSGKK